jgi:uncharacterized protein (TIGR03118 family)
MLSAAAGLAVQPDLPGPDVFGYDQTNLVSNLKGMALTQDPNLVNPWDVNSLQNNHEDLPLVVADQGASLATSYQISPDGTTVMEVNPVVTIPTDGSSEPTGPTGVVYNKHTHEFLIPNPDPEVPDVPATYIFATLQGTIEGYYAGGIPTPTAAEIVVNKSSTGAQYTGLAAGKTADGQDYIYAANEGMNPGIQVFNSSFQPVTQFGTKKNPVANPFIDPDLRTGFVPYGIRDLSLGTHQESYLFVTYRGPNFQGGAIAVFRNDGMFLGQIASDVKAEGTLQSPWGLAFIKHSFGLFSDDLLVGNYSSGEIDAYKVKIHNGKVSAALDGLLLDGSGLRPLTIPGLRAIHFAPGLADSGRPGHTHVGLLFTAEIDNYHNGIYFGNLSLYGEITPNKVNLLTRRATGTSGISRIPQVNSSSQGNVLVDGVSGVLPAEGADKNSIIGGADGSGMLDSDSAQDIAIADNMTDNENAVALQAIASNWSNNRDTIDLETASDSLFRRVGMETFTTELELAKQQTFI